MTREVQAYIEKLPKAELHLHLEGSISAELFVRLSRKYKTEYASATAAEVSSELFVYENFSEFLAIYREVCEVLREPEDYLLLFNALGEYLLSQNILYAEVIYTPSIPWKFGRDGKDILGVLTEAARRFEKDNSIAVRWILDCVRQFKLSFAEQTAELAVDYSDRGVVALGLGGDEKACSLNEFKEVFGWIRAHQLFVHIHAGEIGEPSDIWDALEIMGANRIGHGIQAARDGLLMTALRDRAVGLDLCLTSNARTRAWPMISDHPLPLFLKRGVPVTLNTDDPGLFETTLNIEYKKAVDAFNLGEEELTRLSLQGIRSSFLPHGEKMRMMQLYQEKIMRLKEDSELG